MPDAQSLMPAFERLSAKVAVLEGMAGKSAADLGVLEARVSDLEVADLDRHEALERFEASKAAIGEGNGQLAMGNGPGAGERDDDGDGASAGLPAHVAAQGPSAERSNNQTPSGRVGSSGPARPVSLDASPAGPGAGDMRPGDRADAPSRPYDVSIDITPSGSFGMGRGQSHHRVGDADAAHGPSGERSKQRTWLLDRVDTLVASGRADQDCRCVAALENLDRSLPGTGEVVARLLAVGKQLVIWEGELDSHAYAARVAGLGIDALGFARTDVVSVEARLREGWLAFDAGTRQGELVRLEVPEEEGEEGGHRASGTGHRAGEERVGGNVDEVA